MPLFFFAFDDHNGRVNRFSLDLSDAEAAYAEAVRFAGELICEMSSDPAVPNVALKLVVTDEGGRILCGMTFAGTDRVTESNATLATTVPTSDPLPSM